MKITDTKAVKTYFRGNPRSTRCTALVEIATGHVLLEVMAITTRKQLFKQYTDSLAAR